MFTGIIEEVGTVISSRDEGDGRQLEIAAASVTGKIQVGNSMAVNGCCLTVTSCRGDRLMFDLLQETLARTNLRNLPAGSRVNLETALVAGAPLGGHFVQGHIDCAAPILSAREAGADLRLEVALPNEFAGYVVSKGSIAIDGISLTVAEVLPSSFAVWIIPHTRAQTNLGSVKAGDLVNLEFDLLAKYVERLLDRSTRPPT